MFKISPTNLGLIWLAFFATSLRGDDSDQRPLFRSAFPLDSLRSVTPADAKLSAEILVAKLVESEGYNYNASVLKDNQSLINGIEKNEYDFFLMSGYKFLQEGDRLGIKPVLLGVRNGEDPRTELILLINREKGIEGAKGGELTVQKGSGELPLIWLEEEFAEKNLPTPEQYFGKITPSDSANQTVLSVFFGKNAACIVSLDSYEVMVELNPQIDKRLEKFVVSAPLLSSVICLREGFKEIRDGMINEIATSLHNDPDSEQILALMSVKRLNSYQPELLESLASLFEKRAKRLSTSPEAQTPIAGQ